MKLVAAADRDRQSGSKKGPCRDGAVLRPALAVAEGERLKRRFVSVPASSTLSAFDIALIQAH